MGKSSAKSATNILTKHRVVLQGDGDSPDAGERSLHFAALESPDEHFLPRDVWEEMGKPETVTVTVRPGDHLNTEQ